MYKQLVAATMLAGLFILSGCHNHNPENGGHAHDEDGNHMTESHEAEPEAYTLRTNAIELFVEFGPFMTAAESSIIAHYTILAGYVPVTEGEVSIMLEQDGQISQEVTSDIPVSPGIWLASIVPLNSGTYDLRFRLNSADYADEILIPNVQVYENEAAAIAAQSPETNDDAIVIFKEQAWRAGLEIIPVKRTSIQEVIHTTGEFKPIKGEEKIVAAKSSGIVFFKSAKLQEGRDVSLGESLFSISSEGLIESNMGEKFEVAKAKFNQTKADYERAIKLVEKQIIGQREFEQRKTDFAVAEASFQKLTRNYNVNGQTVSSPMTGIVKNVLVTDGQFVEEGSPLVEITNNRRLLLQGDVSQAHMRKLSSVKTANFKTAYTEEIQSIDDYNGRLVSYGKVLEEGSSFVSVLFELDNLRELIPGSYAELFLLTNPVKDQIVIPRSALMQDYNVDYVYLQIGGESYEKREVKLGIDDGINVQVLSGIEEGDLLVTQGAYQVKMASMSSTIPSHGHEH